MIELRWLQSERSDAHPPVLQYRIVLVESRPFIIDGSPIGKMIGLIVDDAGAIQWSEWITVPTLYESKTETVK